MKKEVSQRGFLDNWRFQSTDWNPVICLSVCLSVCPSVSVLVSVCLSGLRRSSSILRIWMFSWGNFMPVWSLWSVTGKVWCCVGVCVCVIVIISWSLSLSVSWWPGSEVIIVFYFKKQKVQCRYHAVKLWCKFDRRTFLVVSRCGGSLCDSPVATGQVWTVIPVRQVASSDFSQPTSSLDVGSSHFTLWKKTVRLLFSHSQSLPHCLSDTDKYSTSLHSSSGFSKYIFPVVVQYFYRSGNNSV